MISDGICEPRFEAVRAAFENNWAEHGEVGASVAVTVNGEMVVDLWGGTATYDHGEDAWERDTIVNVWSTTKTMAALCCLILVDRGELDPHATIATFWPEFAANGKDAVTTAQVMSHAAGLSGWDEALTMDDLLDHDKIVGLLAAQAPWWEPGSASGYHAISQGYLLGEVVARITGRSLGAFLADEVTGPIGADFHIGTSAEHDHRVAHVIPPPNALVGGDGVDESSIAYRTLSNPMLTADYSSRHDWRRAEIPAAGGHGNARSVAAIHAPTACGGTAKGVTLLSPAGVGRIFDEQVAGTDLVLGTELKMGLGFGLPIPLLPFPNPHTAFWGGWGGSLAIIDTDARMSFSYVMNKMSGGTHGDMRGMNLHRAALPEEIVQHGVHEMA